MDRYQLSPALRNELTELIGRSFWPKEVDHVGQLLIKGYDSNSECGESKHVTLTARRCAEVLVETCEEKSRTPALIKLIADLDGTTVLGRGVTVEDLEIFLSHLVREGLVFDRQSGRILGAGHDPLAHPGWGALRDGRTYRCTVASLDVVGSSALVRRHGNGNMEKVNARLWAFLRERIARFEGRRWAWAGDGGVLAFTFSDHVARAVACMLEIQRSLPVFNLYHQDRIGEPIEIRIGLDTGDVGFQRDTGGIVSDVINYAAHLEKKVAAAGALVVSDDVWGELDGRLRSVFTSAGELEGRSWRATGRLDQIHECRAEAFVTPKTISSRARKRAS